jgi:hypothetical protein
MLCLKGFFHAREGALLNHNNNIFSKIITLKGELRISFK